MAQIKCSLVGHPAITAGISQAYKLIVGVISANAMEIITQHEKSKQRVET